MLGLVEATGCTYPCNNLQLEMKFDSNMLGKGSLGSIIVHVLINAPLKVYRTYRARVTSGRDGW